MVFFVVAAFLMVEGADAFCVYNKTDIVITVRQTSGDFGGIFLGDKMLQLAKKAATRKEKG